MKINQALRMNVSVMADLIVRLQTTDPSDLNAQLEWAQRLTNAAISHELRLTELHESIRS